MGLRIPCSKISRSSWQDMTATVVRSLSRAHVLSVAPSLTISRFLSGCLCVCFCVCVCVSCPSLMNFSGMCYRSVTETSFLGVCCNGPWCSEGHEWGTIQVDADTLCSCSMMLCLHMWLSIDKLKAHTHTHTQAVSAACQLVHWFVCALLFWRCLFSVLLVHYRVLRVCFVLNLWWSMLLWTPGQELSRIGMLLVTRRIVHQICA